MSEDHRARIAAKLRHLPGRPGVYLMKDTAGQVLYVGKAKSLRARVRSYFARTAQHSPKTRELVRRAADLETIVVDSEAEALILENNLIKEYHPRFNVNLKDDKTYPYIKVTVQEAFPRVMVTRRLVRDGARYFGPFTDVRRMRQTLELVKRLYTVRSCHYRLPNEAPPRPCLDYHIGRCKAPCVALQDEADYVRMVQEVVEVLSGHPNNAAARVRAEMDEAAAQLHFERAAELRDVLTQLELLRTRQKADDPSGSDRDVIGFARDADLGCGVVLRVREGKLLGREAKFLSNLDAVPDPDALSVFASRFYLQAADTDPLDLPGEILFPAEFPDRLLLEEALTQQQGVRVRTHVPQRGEKVRLVHLAEQNARHLLEEQKLLWSATTDRAPDALYELQEALELQSVPRTVAGFDVSHTQGSETVASVVFFENGAPNKGEYRKLRIKGGWGNDDFRSMHEAVSRYVRRRVEEARPLPDLLLIDGGKGQLNAARQALQEADLAEQPVASLAKRDEEVFLPGRSAPLRLPRRSAALRLLQQVRDEAHRFAVSYNRKLRTQRTVRSELASIPGVGAARQRALLTRFGSLRGVAAASEEEIAQLPGFGAALARAVRSHLQAGAAGG